jgi:hypothetical protein
VVEVEFDVELRDGRTTTLDLDHSGELPSTVLGRLALDGGWESGWTSWLSSREHHAQGRVAPDGSFRLELLGPGAARLELTASRPTGEQLHLSRELELRPGELALGWSAATGGVELRELPPPAPSHEARPQGGYALVREDAEGWAWCVELDPDDAGRWSGERVPAGEVELRRRRAIGDTDWRSWPALGSFELAAGTRASYAPPRGR